MKDQAQKLRELISTSRKTESPEITPGVQDARVITISSGKGGVGKTNFTVNLAIALSRRNYRVSVIDADLGLANVDVIMGVVPKYTLTHVVKNEMDIREVVLEGPEGIKVISGGSGVMELVNIDSESLDNLISSLAFLNEESEFILVDTGAGLSQNVMSFIRAASEVILVLTPDPSAITDAYALIKNIAEQDKQIRVVINRVESNKEGQDVFNKIHSAAKKFLKVDIESLGFIYEDPNVGKSVRKQIPFMVNYPNCLASKGVDMIAANLTSQKDTPTTVRGFDVFLNKLFNNLQR